MEDLITEVNRTQASKIVYSECTIHEKVKHLILKLEKTHPYHACIHTVNGGSVPKHLIFINKSRELQKAYKLEVRIKNNRNGKMYGDILSCTQLEEIPSYFRQTFNVTY